MREYAPLYGPKGVVVRVYDDHIFVGGSNAWYHWLHHVLPGARRREIDCGTQVASIAINHGIHDVRGLSIGGCIAQIAATVMFSWGPVKCTTYGTKQAPRNYRFNATNYRHRGDIVPYICFWRPQVSCIRIGPLRPLWIAHKFESYREALR